MSNNVLKYISVIPVAAESLGVRSMCTFVKTRDIKILLDAGVSLCPTRFGLPPHQLEFKAIEASRKKIEKVAEKTELITISHYHYDHYTPFYEDWLSNWTKKDETAKQLYKGKMVLLKYPKDMINYSQRRRGWYFINKIKKYSKKIEIADGKTFSFGKTTKIKFSEPVFHGSENSPLGWVLMTVIEVKDEKFMFAPDVQGPMSRYTLKIILKENPQLLMIGGPPVYLSDFLVNEERIQAAFKNLEKIVEKVPTTIIEHHILRQANWRKYAKNLIKKAKKSKHNLLTAAEYLKEKNYLLEAKRKILFKEKPPSNNFKKWMKKSEENKRSSKPPI
jgi:predicted metallo-beta-lactamase superfamily hydrolase